MLLFELNIPHCCNFLKPTGVRKLMFEVAKKPLEIRKSAVSSLLWYVVRGSSSRLHSRAEQVLRLLVDKSLFVIGDQFTGGKLIYYCGTFYFASCKKLEVLDPYKIAIRSFHLLYFQGDWI